MNACRKGKRGEREWRDVLRKYGYTARRGQQFSGGADSPDVICAELQEWLHFEVKRVESLNIHNAISQANRDAGGKYAAVAHKRNRGGWLLTMNEETFFYLLRARLMLRNTPHA